MKRDDFNTDSQKIKPFNENFLLHRKKVAEFLVEKVEDVSKEIKEFLNNEDEDKDYNYFESYLKCINTEKMMKFVHKILEKEGYFNFNELFRMFYNIWPVNLDGENDSSEEEQETGNEKGYKESIDVMVVPISDEAWSFYVTYDYLDWEIWENRYLLT